MWETVYTTKDSGSLSWFQATPAQSLALIAGTEVPSNARSLDVGGGDSSLVDRLSACGYQNIIVLDIASSALERAKRRLGASAGSIEGMAVDILEAHGGRNERLTHHVDG